MDLQLIKTYAQGGPGSAALFVPTATFPMDCMLALKTGSIYVVHVA